MNLPDPCGSGQQFEFMLACFVQTLIDGNNITNATIRAKTVKGYLEAVSELFELRNFESPYQPHRSENMPAFMISLLEKWENMPSRREPISAEMTDYLERRASEADPDSITAVVWDWYALSRYTGFRIAEFGQRTQDKADYHETRAGKKVLKAFNFSDFTFRDDKRRLIKDIRKIKNTDKIAQLFVRWRIQKNRRNGEKINLYRDEVNVSLCPVRAGIRIVLRAHRLKVTEDEPIAVYVNKKGLRKYVTGSKIAEHFREAATEVHGITDKKELSLYSAHSMRVTAAVLLHQANKSGSYIKIRLRWASDTFMMYLRNTLEQAKQHVNAVTEENERIIELRMNPENCPTTVAYSVTINEEGPILTTNRDECL